MDRQIVYPGSIPLDTDLLNIQRNVMVAMGYLAQATLGSTSIADGLACTPTAPASLSVVIGPGSITQFGVVDSEAFGSLPALSDPLLRIGVSLNPVTFTLTPPSVPGQSINYLVEASLLEVDATPVVLPYYNAANPAQPYSGPNNTGVAQATQRLQSVQLQVKAGVPATTGQQGIPAVDFGWVPLYIIGVPAGATAITAQNIFSDNLAPFIFWKLPQLTPGTHNLAVFEPTTQGGWQVPDGVGGVKVRVWGGGGAGGAAFTTAGGGGAGGGYVEGFYSVSPGSVFPVSVGNGGRGRGIEWRQFQFRQPGFGDRRSGRGKWRFRRSRFGSCEWWCGHRFGDCRDGKPRRKRLWRIGKLAEWRWRRLFWWRGRAVGQRAARRFCRGDFRHGAWRRRIRRRGFRTGRQWRTGTRAHRVVNDAVRAHGVSVFTIFPRATPGFSQAHTMIYPFADEGNIDVDSGNA